MVIKPNTKKIRPSLYVVVDGEESVATNEQTKALSNGHLMVTSDEVLVWTGEKQPTIDTSRTLIFDPLPTVSEEGVMMIEI